MEALVEQEFRDAGYEELVRRSAEFNRFGRDQSIYAIREIAALHVRHRHHWQEFQLAHGIALKPRRGPTARSIFQPICRHLLGLGDGGDAMGLASVWAAVLDEWVQTAVAPAEIPAWIAGRGGMRAIYEGGDDLIRQTDSDIVYTSPALARRIVDYLDPEGFCVDPCRGRGAFYDALDPENRDWCEIREGRDFLTWEFDRPVDWCITNPPFSDAYANIAARAFSIAKNVAFLVKLPVAIGTYARHRAWREAGHGLREIIYLPWAEAEFLAENNAPKAPEGFVLTVVWWQRGWQGEVRHTYWTSQIDKERSHLEPSQRLKYNHPHTIWAKFNAERGVSAAVSRGPSKMEMQQAANLQLQDKRDKALEAVAELARQIEELQANGTGKPAIPAEPPEPVPEAALDFDPDLMAKKLVELDRDWAKKLLLALRRLLDSPAKTYEATRVGDLRARHGAQSERSHYPACPPR